MPKYHVTIQIVTDFQVTGLEAPSDADALRRAREAFENIFTPQHVALAFSHDKTEISDWEVEHDFLEEETSEEEDDDNS